VGIGSITGHRKLPENLETGLRINDESMWRTYHESDEIYPIKTHAKRDELFSTRLPTIMLARDGRDAYVSLVWYWITVAHPWRIESPSRRAKLLVLAEKAAKALGLKRFLFRHVLDQLVNRDRWADFNESWLAGKHPAMAVLHFRDLIQNTIQSCHAAVDNIGAISVRGGSCELPDFESLHQQYPQFFRKGKRGNWRDEMNQAQVDSFWSNHSESMEMLGDTKSHFTL